MRVLPTYRRVPHSKTTTLISLDYHLMFRPFVRTMPVAYIRVLGAHPPHPPIRFQHIRRVFYLLLNARVRHVAFAKPTRRETIKMICVIVLHEN